MDLAEFLFCLLTAYIHKNFPRAGESFFLRRINIGGEKND